MEEIFVGVIFRGISLREKCPYSDYSGPHFPTFGLNMERYSVPLRIRSECGKIRTRLIPNTNTFHAVFFFGFYLRITKLTFSKTKKICLIEKTLSAKLKNFEPARQQKQKSFLKIFFEAIFCCFLWQTLSNATGSRRQIP